jgi:MOSC domain-containing protein YiiM
MWKGKVLSIYITPNSAAPLTSVKSVRTVPGRGLEGDRYFYERGFYSNKPGPDREMTLIEIEAIEALNRDYQVKISPGDARRNVVTQGVPLNHLVGEEFVIGEVHLKGIRLCEPCAYLANLLDNKKVMNGLVHRGGLRAQILSEGIINVNDTVRVL